MSEDKSQQGPDQGSHETGSSPELAGQAQAFAEGETSPEPAGQAWAVMLEWQGYWLATIAKAWAAMDEEAGSDDKEWLKQLLSSTPSEVKAAILKAAGNSMSSLPNYLNIRVKMSGKPEIDKMENNELTLYLPPKPAQDALQAQSLVEYQRSGRVYPFTTF